ncbi:hypothetical protein C8R45DRAFT_1183367 [Mycena sanguinolenta]|nr:hypothetical protein C8R45DRAFT_1183367 [Mycena sanguinolenta]
MNAIENLAQHRRSRNLVADVQSIHAVDKLPKLVSNRRRDEEDVKYGQRDMWGGIVEKICNWFRIAVGNTKRKVNRWGMGMLDQWKLRRNQLGAAMVQQHAGDLNRFWAQQYDRTRGVDTQKDAEERASVLQVRQDVRGQNRGCKRCLPVPPHTKHRRDRFFRGVEVEEELWQVGCKEGGVHDGTGDEPGRTGRGDEAGHTGRICVPPRTCGTGDDVKYDRDVGTCPNDDMTARMEWKNVGVKDRPHGKPQRSH